ncbi:unnamed protein product [Candidula unifasciata]|uniref:Tetratricopeptide repeat protein 33 n=1 Tax=Candidula unifasciata TaxID=100452 RepID=A0A8S3Z3A8_9EUPU|nr:unnamed protein product [Candidula unifasciata]
MTSFGWKRKVGEKLRKTTAVTFSSDATDAVDEESNEVDWLTLAPKRKFISLEDSLSKSERLKAEGAVLAESERYWEAIKKWDEAMQLTPLNEKILEMKAQALMAVGEVFPALQAAERVVALTPTWWVGHQTLGRALANIGEVKLALKSFARAVHLNPVNEELWLEDLMWTKSLLERKKLAASAVEEQLPHGRLVVTELTDEGISASGGQEKENSLVVYSKTESSTDAGSHSERNEHLRVVPTNYVQMRDAT